MKKAERGIVLLFFKRLEKETQRVFRECKREVVGEHKDLLSSELQLLMEIADYVKNGAWLSPKAMERLCYCLKHSVSDCAAHFDCDKQSIYSSMNKYSRKIEQLLGDNIIDLIVSGKVEEARLQFDMATNALSFDKLFLEGFVNKLPNSRYSGDCLLSDCVQELTFLKAFSLANQYKMFKGLNKDKLAHIRYVLEVNDSDTVNERQILWEYLSNSSVGTADTVVKLKEIAKNNGVIE